MPSNKLLSLGCLAELLALFALFAPGSWSEACQPRRMQGAPQEFDGLALPSSHVQPACRSAGRLNCCKRLLSKRTPTMNLKHHVVLTLKNMRQSVWHLHVHVPRFDAVLAQTVPPDDPLGR